MIIKIPLLFAILFLFSLPLAAETVVRVDENEPDIQSILDNSFVGAEDPVLEFEPGEYRLNLIVTDKVRLRGRATRDVIIRPADIDLPVIQVDGAVDVSIQNMTFLDANIGVQVLPSLVNLNLAIQNNAFHLGKGLQEENIAIEVAENSPGVTIEHNVFYQNDIAVQNANPATNVQLNIFDDNGLDLSLNTAINVGSNCFGQAERGFDASSRFASILATDILFVDKDSNDFHLRVGSDCVVTADNSEVVYGAYGGQEADRIPAAVAIESHSTPVEANGQLQIQFTWQPNKAREVVGYKLYYAELPLQGLNSLDARKSLSYVDIPDRDASSQTLDQLKANPDIPGTPVLESITPRDRKLLLKWTTVENADEYAIYYTGHEDQPVITTGTEYTLTGLDNNQVYTVWLKAISRLDYYFQVAAYQQENSSSTFAESFFLNDDVKIEYGEPVYSEESNKISMQPEAIEAYPPLPNEGCFIATAAWGYYSAKEVRVLRDFRDDYLLKTPVGRAFVRWYYHYGPYAADVIRQSEILKALVRWALYPLVLLVELLNVSLAGFVFVLILCVILVFSITVKLCHWAARKI